MGGSVSSFVEDIGGGIGDAVSGVGGVISDLGSSVDDFVNSEIPGGWVGAAALAAGGYYYYPEISAWLGPEGAIAGTEAGTTATAASNAGATTLLDYSLPSSTGGLGLQGSAALDGTLASGLAAPAGGSLGGGLGLTAGAAGNLAAMGGAQGLLANAAGGGVLGEGGVNTGLLTANNLYDTVVAAAPVVTDPLTAAWNGLTASEAANLAKAGVSLAGLLGGTAALGNLVGGGVDMVTLPAQNRAGVSSGSAQYSPEYYQAIQAKYNQMMPQQPRDVTTDLKSWYETKYAPTTPTTQQVA